MRRLLLVACGLWPVFSGIAAEPALKPPVDTTEWKKPRAGEPLKVLKPASAAPAPLAADYLRVLERFPLLCERGWRGNYLGDPELGFFGDPEHAEMGLRAMGNVVFTLSLLASDPQYDPKVSGISQAQVLARAKSVLAYMTRSHVTGDIPCGDGKPWGNHWQSAWWTGKMALGAQLIWDKLSPTEQARVQKVVVHEADRHLERKAPNGAFKDTKSEETGWDTEVLAAALSLFPKHEHAPQWRAKLIEFYLNSLSTADDAKSDRQVDGKPLSEQVYTANIHPDYTIENHGAYHFCYMACPLHSIGWGNYALRKAGLPVPMAQFHHFKDVWERVKPTFLEERFAYVSGKDWPRYAYGLYFIMPALVVMQHEYHDPDARYIEAQRFQTFEREQLDNADGSFFGKRFTRNMLLNRTGEYETDCYANLGVCYLLHQLQKEPPLPPATAAEFAKRNTTRHVSEVAGLAFVRTPELFASYSSHALNGPPLALFVPAGMDNATEWGVHNLLGQVKVKGVKDKPESKCEFISTADALEARQTLTYSGSNGQPAYRQEVVYRIEPTAKRATVSSKFVALADVTVELAEGLRLHVANDFFNRGERTWQSAAGTHLAKFDLGHAWPDKETIQNTEMGRGWVNLDNKLGIVALEQRDAPFVLRSSDRRNTPFHSLHYDVLICPWQAEARKVRAGETILSTKFLVLAADAAATRQAAQAK